MERLPPAQCSRNVERLARPFARWAERRSCGSSSEPRPGDRGIFSELFFQDRSRFKVCRVRLFGL